ncbi:immunoglobulin-like domain-containing protein [Psychrobacillus sp. NPDC093180]|uniref:immunoglobulin-like domain-containing protein n=1 Tax=Psychrobacillus sp. NPDC093180 TaxID=3364489 RepID=UPI00382DC453
MGGESATTSTPKLNLPKNGINGTTITWTSDTTTWVANSGAINRPGSGAPKEVTLTATIKKGTAEATQTFKVTVPNNDDADSSKAGKQYAPVTVVKN